MSRIPRQAVAVVLSISLGFSSISPALAGSRQTRLSSQPIGNVAAGPEIAPVLRTDSLLDGEAGNQFAEPSKDFPEIPLQDQTAIESDKEIEAGAEPNAGAGSLDESRSSITELKAIEDVSNKVNRSKDLSAASLRGKADFTSGATNKGGESEKEFATQPRHSPTLLHFTTMNNSKIIQKENQLTPSRSNGREAPFQELIRQADRAIHLNKTGQSTRSEKLAAFTAYGEYIRSLRPTLESNALLAAREKTGKPRSATIPSWQSQFVRLVQRWAPSVSAESAEHVYHFRIGPFVEEGVYGIIIPLVSTALLYGFGFHDMLSTATFFLFSASSRIAFIRSHAPGSRTPAAAVGMLNAALLAWVTLVPVTHPLLASFNSNYHVTFLWLLFSLAHMFVNVFYSIVDEAFGLPRTTERAQQPPARRLAVDLAPKLRSVFDQVRRYEQTDPADTGSRSEMDKGMKEIEDFLNDVIEGKLPPYYKAPAVAQRVTVRALPALEYYRAQLNLDASLTQNERLKRKAKLVSIHEMLRAEIPHLYPDLPESRR